MNLRDATNWLLRAHDAATQLRIADNYIQTYNRLPEKFVLPAEHADLKPIVESFASDADAFAQYIKAIRDASTGTAYEELHELYRTISMRAMQSQRRARIRRAVQSVVPKLEQATGRLMTYEDHLKIARYIEHRWGELRLDHLAHERRLRNSKRLTSEERNIALGNFWSAIDKRLDAGDLGIPAEYLLDLERQLRR